jgi:DNA-binding NarL/FixJ family response regulator
LEGLHNLLHAGGYQVVGATHDGLEALDQARRLHPDVILMDIRMPRCDGLCATRLIHAELPQIKIVMLTTSAEDSDLFEALKSGASGYLLKGSGLSDLVKAIRAVHDGEAFFSPAIAMILLRDSRGETPAETKDPGDGLTKREREVLTLVGEGKSSPEIAKLLHLSVKTIEGHRGRIMAKLECRNVAGLVRQAIRLGLVTAE